MFVASEPGPSGGLALARKDVPAPRHRWEGSGAKPPVPPEDGRGSPRTPPFGTLRNTGARGPRVAPATRRIAVGHGKCLTFFSTGGGPSASRWAELRGMHLWQFDPRGDIVVYCGERRPPGFQTKTANGLMPSRTAAFAPRQRFSA